MNRVVFFFLHDMKIKECLSRGPMVLVRQVNYSQ